MQNDDVYKLYTGTKYKADWYHYNRKRIEEEKKKSKKEIIKELEIISLALYFLFISSIYSNSNIT